MTPLCRPAIVALLMCATSMTAQSFELRLETPVSSKLPGLPVPLRLVAINGTNHEQRLPQTVWIHATRGEAQQFLGTEYTTWQREVPEGEEGVTDPRILLAPGGTITAELAISGQCEGPSSTLSAFLDTPGRYTLRAVTSPAEIDLPDLVRARTLQEIVEAIPGTVISLPATVDVATPQGMDAAAWQMLVERTNGLGWTYTLDPDRHAILASELRTRFPTSEYAYCFGAGYLHRATDADLETVVSNMRTDSSAPPMLDWLELSLAGKHESRCLAHLLPPNRNVAAAITECNLAQTQLNRIAGTNNPLVREKAQKIHPMPEERIRNYVQQLEAIEAGTYRRLTPLVQCVKETGKEMAVTFAYLNDNAFTVYDLPGARNFFSPAPEERGQPSTFLPGLHTDAITIAVPGKKNDPRRAVSWTLEENTASAPLETAPRCKGK